MKEYIISIEVEDKPGVLTRISSLFSRRGFNVKSLTVAKTHKQGLSRFTIAVNSDEKILEQIRKQAQKLIHIITTEHLDETNAVIREVAVIKLNYKQKYRMHVNNIVDLYGARLIGYFEDVLLVEVSGSSVKIDKIFQELQGDYILESQRTGKIAISIDTK